MRSLVAGVTFVAVMAHTALASQCTDTCTANYPPIGANPVVQICGTDHVSYNTTKMAILNCFRTTCGLGVLAPGFCECPNNCTSGVNGNCVGSPAKCECAAGWGGRDCNTVVCPANTCSGHGTCDAELNMCKCGYAFTGPDCSTARLTTTDTPWGCPIPPLYSNSGCAQPPSTIPWFDFRGLPQLRITVDPTSFAKMLSPAHIQERVYHTANATFQSESEGWKRDFTNVGLKLHGGSTRADAKKSYAISFKNATTTVGAAWPKLFMKASGGFIAAQYMTTLLQTIGSPVERASYALYFVNDVYYGLYMMLGDFNKEFQQFAYGPNASDIGSFHKGEAGNFFQNTHSDFKPKMEKDYTNFVNWIAVANQSVFEADIFTVFDTDSYIRAIAAQSLVMLSESVVTGNNYQLYNGPQAHWSISTRDFDKVFHDKRTNVMTWAMPTDHPCPLGKRLFAVPAFVAAYKNTYETFLNATAFNTQAGVPTPASWYMGFVPFLQPWLAADKMEFLTTNSRNLDLAKMAIEDSGAFAARFHDVMGQLAN